MSEKKRPTCVSVIGWVWIILGAFMCFSAVMGLFASLMMGQMAGADPEMQSEMPAFVRFFPLLAIAQVGLAILAIVAGVKFLKLQAWARAALEGLTWFFLTFIVGFGIFWVIMWCSMSSRGGPPGFTIFGAVMGVASLAFYGVPMGIVLKFLRGQTVKEAMQGNAEPNIGQVSSEGAPSAPPDEPSM
jgi:hypothetical protein